MRAAVSLGPASRLAKRLRCLGWTFFPKPLAGAIHQPAMPAPRPENRIPKSEARHYDSKTPGLQQPINY
jgi:hypothetical protein